MGKKMDREKLNIMYSITPQAPRDKKFSKVRGLLYYPIYLQYIQKILSTYPHTTFENFQPRFYYLLK